MGEKAKSRRENMRKRPKKALKETGKGNRVGGLRRGKERRGKYDEPGVEKGEMIGELASEMGGKGFEKPKGKGELVRSENRAGGSWMGRGNKRSKKKNWSTPNEGGPLFKSRGGVPNTELP